MVRRISRHQMLMGMAEIASRRSTCERSQVGVVIALDSRPLVSGYNGAPAKMPHCDHTCSDDECSTLTHPSGVEKIIHGPTCPAGTPCKVAVHAEANAIAWAAREGVMLWTSTLFTTMMPCYACSQLIINAGIVEVVYSRAYRDESGRDLLEAAGVRVCQLAA